MGERGQLFTVIISGVTDLAGNATVGLVTSTFTTIPAPRGPVAIDLQTAGDYALLSGTGATLGAAALIDGDVGVITGPATGFVLVADPSGLFSTSDLVTGRVFTAADIEPTPSALVTAGEHLEDALADGAGRVDPDGVNLGAGEIGGLVIEPGLYQWAGAVTLTTNVTLDGGPDDEWIMQMGAAFSVTAAISTQLTGGAQAKNVYWVVTGAVAVGAGGHLDGNVLSRAAVSAGANATVDGRMLGQTTVGIGAGVVVTQPE